MPARGLQCLYNCTRGLIAQGQPTPRSSDLITFPAWASDTYVAERIAHQITQFFPGKQTAHGVYHKWHPGNLSLPSWTPDDTSIFFMTGSVLLEEN